MPKRKRDGFSGPFAKISKQNNWNNSKSRFKTKKKYSSTAGSNNNNQGSAEKNEEVSRLETSNEKKRKKKKKKKKKKKNQDSQIVPDDITLNNSKSKYDNNKDINSHAFVNLQSPPKKPTKPPKPYQAKDKSCRYLLPSHREYTKCLNTSYSGFVRIPENHLPSNLHKSVLKALETLRKEGIYHHDVVSAGKNAISGTMCKRVLVGDPGMTYYYQKLRLFALPWCNSDTKLNKACNKISNLGDALNKIASEYKKTTGSANYNVCLINFMPDGKGKYPLRNETNFGIGKMSVSWHADSSLQEFSTIGVYHVTGSTSSNWAIASRVTNDNQTPALVVPLKNKDTYFMLDDFNHHHQHAVITGSSWRYSCTMRVAITKNDTWEYIDKKGIDANNIAIKLKARLTKNKNNLMLLKDTLDPQILRQLGSVNLEIEFQWLRMFFIQGTEHMKAHEQYWLPRIEKLEKVWANIERIIYSCVEYLNINKESSFKPSRRTLDILLWLLRERKTLRLEYNRRIRHSAYKVLEPKWRPILNRPTDLEDSTNGLLDNLDGIISIVDYYLRNKLFV